jgi:hypothetical protein
MSMDRLIEELLNRAELAKWRAKDAQFRLANRNDSKYPHNPEHDRALYAENYHTLSTCVYKLLVDTDTFHTPRPKRCQNKKLARRC